MAMIDDLKTRFPEIDTTLIDNKFPIYETVYTAYYNQQYGINAFENEIILNVIAHLIVTEGLTASNGSAGVSVVASESAGSVSRSYAVQPMENEDKFWNSTIYGQRYKLLASRNLQSHFV